MSTFKEKETFIIDNKQRRKPHQRILKEEGCHNLAMLLAKDIKRYLEMGGDIRHMTFDDVYKVIDPNKDTRKEIPLFRILGVRGDDKNDSRI